MHTKHYDHPAPHVPDHDYKHDMQKVWDHIKDIVCDGYHKGHMQHLGGAAALHDHLTELHYGHSTMIKKELKRVLDYLYMYADTGHTIYHFLAEDAFKHVEQLQMDAQDPDERAHIQVFLEYVKEYMGWLKAEKTGSSHAADASGKVTF